MKQKLEGKNKKRSVWLMYFAKAASVILFIGLGILGTQKINNYLSDKETIVTKKNKTFFTEEISNKKNEITINYNNKKQDLDSKNQQEIIKKKIKKDFQKKKKLHNEKFGLSENIKNTNNSFSEKNNLCEKNKITNNETKNKNNLTKANTILKKDIVKITKKNIADLSNIKNNDSLQLDKSDNYKNKKPILMPEDKDFFKHKKTNKKIDYSIAFSSHYSSSDIGAVDKINIGGGFQTYYNISEKVSINSGLLIANHNLNTPENIETNKELYASKNTSLAEISQTQILLVGVDIPLNIQFNINKMYVSTGISSLFYLKESYTKNYYTENTANIYNYGTKSYEKVYMYDTSSETQNKPAFKTFDFAKLLNISFGYKIPLKKGNIVFEPYAKIPIGKLTSYNISYGYGGLGLKYNF